MKNLIRNIVQTPSFTAQNFVKGNKTAQGKGDDDDFVN